MSITKEPNPVAFSSILNKWRSQRIVIETGQLRLPCVDANGFMMSSKVMFREYFYGFGIWLEFYFPLNDAWCELHSTYQYWFRLEVD